MTRRPIATLVIALLLAAASLLAVSRLRIDTSLTSLFDNRDPAAAALERVLNNFKAVEELIVFAQADDAQPAKLRAFAARLESAVAADPEASKFSDGVVWRADAQFRKFAEEILVPNGLFYLDDAAFDAAKQRLTLDEMRRQIRRNETLISTPGPAADALSKVILQDPLRLHEFVIGRVTAGRAAFKTYENGDAFISPDGRSILIRVRGRRPVSDLEFSKAFTRRISDIAARENTDPLRLDFSGGYAIAAASERAIRGDMISNVIWSVICLQLLFVVAFRRPIRSFSLAFLPVAIGLLYGFGAYAVMSTSLTPMTAVIGGTLAGMSVDYAIEFLTYFHAKRAGGLSALEATVAARRSCGGAMLAAWATSVVGFVAIGTSNVKALRDFAILGSLGLTGAFFAALVILPAMVVVFHRKQRATSAAPGRIPVQAMLGRIIRRPRAGAIATAATLVIAVAVLLAPGEILPLETDLTVMHPRPNPALDAQARIAAAFGAAPGALVVHLSAKSDDELLRLAHEVETRLSDPRCNSAGVTGSFGLGSLLPDPNVASARVANTGSVTADRVVTDFRAAVADSIFDPKAYEPYEQFLRRLLTATTAPTITDLRKYPSLAKTILPANTVANAKSEAITLVFTKDSGAQRESRDTAVMAIRTALADLPGATLTGLSVLNYDTEITVRRELPRVLIVSGVLVMIYMVAHYRNLVDCLLATLPAIFGIACLLAYMRLTGQKLNMINLVAFPLLIGIDVDYGIFIVSAARRGGLRGLSDEQIVEKLAPASSAVILCAATTFIGFSTLIFTSVPAVRSLGAAVAVGVATCAAATFLLVAPALVWLTRRAERKAATA
jgi:predicted RND superfamily exporter protein